MSRYKSTKLRNLGPVHGFLIYAPDDRKLKDTNPQTIVRELNRLNDEMEEKRKDIVYLATEKAKLENYVMRLEEAGDDLYANCDPSRWDSTETTARKLADQNAWRKSKEAKP